MMIHRSGREFLEDDDPLQKDTRFPGGGIEMKDLYPMISYRMHEWGFRTSC